MSAMLCWLGFHAWVAAGMVSVVREPKLWAYVRYCRRCKVSEWWNEWRVNASPRWVRLSKNPARSQTPEDEKP